MNKILIIDDNKFIVNMTAFTLKQTGFTVYSAYDGKSGIEMAKKLLPDLILLDIMMPEITGWDVLDNIRNTTTTKNISVLFFSAKTEEPKKIKTAKVDGFIAKPFEADDLIKKIKFVLEKKRKKDVIRDGENQFPILKKMYRKIKTYFFSSNTLL